MPTVISLFSGAGGLDLGFQNAGFTIVWANDFNKDAVATYNHNIGDHAVHCPIEEISEKKLPECDVVIGGPPCQGFSVAGKMNPQDPRSRMIWEFVRVVEGKKPSFFVMENVPSFGTLKKFEKIRSHLLSTFRSLGYAVEFQILESQFFEVPQKRKRFILIGSNRGTESILFPDPSENVITAREALQDLPDPGIGINQGICNAKITVAQHPVLRKSPYAGMVFNGLGRPINLDRPAQTLPASMGGNKTPILETNLLKNIRGRSWVIKHHKFVMGKPEFDAYAIDPPKYLRRITIREAARIQSFPDGFEFLGSKSSQYCQIGNAVPPMLSFHIAKALLKSVKGKKRKSKPRTNVRLCKKGC